MQHPATILTSQQLQALEFFARGQSVSCIADAVGVSRETLWRWRKQPHFAAALQQRLARQQEMLREQTAELLRLSLSAITRELQKAEDPKLVNPLSTAFKMLNFVATSGLLVEPLPHLLEAEKQPATPHTSANNASLVSV